MKQKFEGLTPEEQGNLNSRKKADQAAVEEGRAVRGFNRSGEKILNFSDNRPEQYEYMRALLKKWDSGKELEIPQEFTLEEPRDQYGRKLDTMLEELGRNDHPPSHSYDSYRQLFENLVSESRFGSITEVINHADELTEKEEEAFVEVLKKTRLVHQYSQELCDNLGLFSPRAKGEFAEDLDGSVFMKNFKKFNPGPKITDEMTVNYNTQQHANEYLRTVNLLDYKNPEFIESFKIARYIRRSMNGGRDWDEWMPDHLSLSSLKEQERKNIVSKILAATDYHKDPRFKA